MPLLLLPMGRASLMYTVRTARRRHPHSAAMLSTTAAAASATGAQDDFLVRNERNEVELLQCPSKAMVRQAMVELGDLPHICVAGESNAGKSSLINHLLRKQLARASSVAGKTRSVDMMRVNEKVVLTDLPGLPSRDHQVSAIWETNWRPLVLDYIASCDSLRAMLYVHDIRWKVNSPPTPLNPPPSTPPTLPQP